MKITLVRAFVVALALTGAVATAHSKTTGHVLSATTANGLPPASCPIHDPNHCGMTDDN